MTRDSSVSKKKRKKREELLRAILRVALGVGACRTTIDFFPFPAFSTCLLTLLLYCTLSYKLLFCVSILDTFYWNFFFFTFLWRINNNNFFSCFYCLLICWLNTGYNFTRNLKRFLEHFNKIKLVRILKY